MAAFYDTTLGGQEEYSVMGIMGNVYDSNISKNNWAENLYLFHDNIISKQIVSLDGLMNNVGIHQLRIMVLDNTI